MIFQGAGPAYYRLVQREAINNYDRGYVWMTRQLTFSSAVGVVLTNLRLFE